MSTKGVENQEEETAKSQLRQSSVAAASTLSVEILQHPVSNLPHEADQSTKNQETEIRPEMLQAEQDIESGMQDTGRSPLVDEVYRRQKK